MTNGVQKRPRQDVTQAPADIGIYDRPNIPQGQPVMPPASQNVQVNVNPGPQQYPPYIPPPCVPYRSEVIVEQRRSSGIIGTIFEIAAGLILLAVIAIVLLTGLGAVIVNLQTYSSLPQPIEEYSLGFYHYFFG